MDENGAVIPPVGSEFLKYFITETRSSAQKAADLGN